MKPVLLLGGGGFIGSALAQRLRQKAMPVIVVGRDKAAQLQQLLPMCSTVVHLASSTTPGSSAKQPELEQVNLRLTQTLVSALQKYPHVHLVYFSSGGAVYGNPTKLPVKEDAPLLPLSHYGVAKVEQEKMCEALRARGHAVTILRPSNGYGPDQPFKGGFGLIRTLLEHARLGTTLQIWGDGENVRDYIYIDDLIDATMCIIDSPDAADTYNVGSGIGYSVSQVKQLVEQITKMPVMASYHAARGVDVQSVVLDTERLSARLGSCAKVALLDGIDLLIRSVSQQ